jgi:hypothetical protein
MTTGMKKLFCVHCIRSENSKKCIPPVNRRQICPNSGLKAKRLIHSDLLTIEIPGSGCHTCGGDGLLCVICAERAVCRNCATFEGHPVCKHCLAEECDCVPESSLLYQFDLPLKPIIPGWSLLSHLKLAHDLKRLRAERITAEEFWADQQIPMSAVLEYLKCTSDKVDIDEFRYIARSIKSNIFSAIKSIRISDWPTPADLLQSRIYPLISRKLIYASRYSKFSNTLRDFCLKTIEAAIAEAKLFRRQVFNLSDSKGKRFKNFERRWLRDGVIKSELAKTWILCKYVTHSRRKWRTTPPVVIH